MNVNTVKTINYQMSTKTRTPYRYNIDIQSLRAGFTKRGGDVTALLENSGTWWAWSHMTKGLYKTSAIFCHVAIGSLATSALAAFLIFEQAYGTTCLLFLSLALYPRY